MVLPISRLEVPDREPVHLDERSGGTRDVVKGLQILVES